MIKSYLLLIASIVINFSGQIIFTEIANKISFLTFNFESIKTIFMYLVYEPNFWLALFIFFIAALFWIVGLKKVALVKAFSIGSLNYILILIYSFFILKEDFSFYKLGSCLLIIFGVIDLSQNENIMLYIKDKFNKERC